MTTTTFDVASIRQRAMLARLNIRTWTGRKLDKRTTAEVHAMKHADSSAGRYSKHCLDKSDLAEILKIDSAARQIFYDLSSPWGDQGLRILPVANFERFAAAMDDAAARKVEAVQCLVRDWPSILPRRAAEMNGLFNPADYPTQAELPGKFSISYAVMEIPDAEDFRVQMDQAQLDRAQAAIKEDCERAMLEATRDCFTRMLEPVSRMAERLRAYNPTKDKVHNPFRDSLVENVRAMVSALPALNISGNTEIASTIERIERDLCAHSPDVLRSNPTLRQETASKAESIAAEVDKIMSDFGDNLGFDLAA